MPQPDPVRVLVWVDCTTGEGRDAFTSVIGSVRERPTWRPCLPPGPDQVDLLAGRDVLVLLRNADAAIIRLFDDAQIERVAAMNKPTVSLVRRHAKELGMPTVTTSGPAIADRAVDHLAERLFRHVGFVGFGVLGWHGDRCEAAAAAADRHGCAFFPYLVDAASPFELTSLVGSPEFREWLGACPSRSGS